MKDPDGILMIEPTGRPAPVPIIDHLTRRMTASWRRRRDSDYMMLGHHWCVCRARSDNLNHWVGEGAKRLTNSLCIHYLAFHRADVSPLELAKVEALSDGEAEPTAAELAAPPSGPSILEGLVRPLN